MNEYEEFIPTVNSFPLLELSPELQLNIFSFLLDEDLDSLSNSCGQFRNIVHRHQRKLYRQTILCCLYCGTDNTIHVNLGRQKCFWVNWSNRNGVPPVVTSISELGNSEWKQTLEETFLGLSVEQFFGKIMERNAGIRLKLNDLQLPHLEILQYAMKHTVSLDINCRVDSLSREMQFRHLFAPRHSLQVGRGALESEPCIVDDEFCRVAGYGVLNVCEGSPRLILTEDQLLTLIRRSDLTNLRIHFVASMSYENIRNAAQVLLETRKVCYITFEEESLEFHLPYPQFSRQIGDERIEIEDTSSSIYELSRRLEKQFCYTNKTRCVKICVVKQQQLGWPDKIILQANSIDP